ncbi:MAG: ATP-dependent Clp protease proteolytic subunit [Chlamydiia bacterium]|nr:ATP-dependent Clp protease proteolytic subunit [Chlamydiia bacterium]
MILNTEFLNRINLQKFESLEDTIDFHILLTQRRIFICTHFDDNLARDVIKKAWFLASIDKKSPITIYINSGGGSVTAGLAIWDQLKLLDVEIITVVTGIAASMGAMLMLAGDSGKRYATANSRIMIHQPSIGGVIEGQATDLIIQADEIMKNRSHLVRLMHERTGISIDDIEKMIDRDNWMCAQKAKDLGFIDHILEEVSVRVA